MNPKIYYSETYYFQQFVVFNQFEAFTSVKVGDTTTQKRLHKI